MLCQKSINRMKKIFSQFFFKPFVTDNTLLCSWFFQPAKNTTLYIIPLKHFLNFLVILKLQSWKILMKYLMYRISSHQIDFIFKQTNFFLFTKNSPMNDLHTTHTWTVYNSWHYWRICNTLFGCLTWKFLELNCCCDWWIINPTRPDQS